MDKLGNNLREIQEALINLLGFDYDTFRCTANFEQGGSDAFSKLTPKESKLVIMKILQLSIFETYEKKCRDIYNILFEEGIKVKQELETLNKLVDFTIEDTLPIEKHIKELNDKMGLCNKFIGELKDQEKTYTEIVYEISSSVQELKDIVRLDKCPTCQQNVTKEHKDEMETRIQKKIDDLKIKLGTENIKENLTRLEKDYLELNSIKCNEVNRYREITERNKKVEEVKKNRQELENRFEVIKKDLETYKKLVVAFGKDGIPSYIIENAIPEIESIVNDLLNLLEVDMVIKLDMQKELKSGGTADTLDINIITNGVSRPYYNYSGGEKFIIDLSLRIALSTILLRRKGCNNSTLIIDEGLGSLDDNNRVKVLKLIGLIKDKFGFKRILVITHCSDIQDELENKIVVEKVDGFSKLRYNI